MKILIIDGVWPTFIKKFHGLNPLYGELSYHKAWGLLMQEAVGQADFYSRNLKTMGHEAEEVIFNDDVLQNRWLMEYGKNNFNKSGIEKEIYEVVKSWGAFLREKGGSIGRKLYARFREPFRGAVGGKSTLESWKLKILFEQVKYFRPDILLNQAVHHLDGNFLREVRPFVKRIVGQHASPIPEGFEGDCYDLMLSSLPNQVEYFRSQGLKSIYFRLGFEGALLNRIELGERDFGVSFVGGFSAEHQERWKIFEKIADRTKMDCWGYGREKIPSHSKLRQGHHGEIWGIEMYRVFARSKIILNRHIDVAGNFANNLRLYEATGMGALLLTDFKENLNDLFQVGKEVVAYRNLDECLEMIRYYQEHEREREEIAKAGQSRTLNEHSYQKRMVELVEIFNKLL